MYNVFLPSAPPGATLPGSPASSRQRSFKLRRLAFLMAFIGLSLGPLRTQADISQVVFSDDFSSNTIDAANYVADAPFFEGGTGDIHAEAGNGVINFVGTTTAQWWSGGTLRVARTFNASEQANLVVSVDRVSEAGVGTASRSALWILDESRTHYVLFADVRGEGGWRYNRNIGEDGDVPTGSGTDIAAFNGASFDDGGQHRMKVVADGSTVKLFLDNQLGTEVKFPFSKIVVEFGSYARANNDTANTVWDNLLVENTQQTKVVFSDDFASGTIDASTYVPDAPFFEGGTGTIHAEAGNGVINFVGSTTVQWWSGGTLRVNRTFDATPDTIVAASIDRVSEAGQGTASRSAFWILDSTRTKYVLFADVRGEGGWRYNRNIGEDGDVPTGSGTDIGVFNGAAFDDGGLHNMKIVADGSTVKLYLDDQLGAEVKFPFTKVVFEFGSYARANNDTANTVWDNFKVETTTPQTSVVFSDDFAGNTIDPGKYQPDAPFFEGGTGDIHAEAGDGAIHFVGTTTQQWWSGGTLRVVPVFNASDESTLTFSIDRVAEAGKGTASRSALWILDETKTKYVLFADVRGEGGWRFNRNIGEDGDVPTGSGTDIAAFNGANFDDGGLHRMKMVADGKTVKLFLDDLFGAEVKFPFQHVVFEFGSYARANNDTADTTWDNVKVEAAGAATFIPTVTSVGVGKTSANLTLRIPPGLNAQNPVTVRVVSADPSVAVPVGGNNGRLDITFPAGGPNTASFKASGVALGGTVFTAEGALPGGNQLTVVVNGGPGIQLTEDFQGGAIDTSKWQVSTRGFESTGAGTYDVSQADGVLAISGVVDTQYWPGGSVITTKAYTATKDLNLVVDVDRPSIENVNDDGSNATGARTGIYLTTADHSKYVFFSQDLGETGWTINVTPNSATGSGTAIAAFNTDLNDNGAHHMQLVADGEGVDVYLDGRFGTRVAFALNVGIYVELGAYSRAALDKVRGTFDNVQIQNALPCTKLQGPAGGLLLTTSDNSQEVTVTIPSLLNASAAATVQIASSDKSVAVPGGAASGVLTLNFPAGGANSQSFKVTPVAPGSAIFTATTTPATCVKNDIHVSVVVVPQVLLADNFDTGDTFDSNLWRQDETSFETGTSNPDESAITVENGQVKIKVTTASARWPGLALFTVNSYDASATTPLTFEVDRVKLDFVLVTGTGAKQRSGIWVKDANGNFVFFADFEAHDGGNFGWTVNSQIGADTDNPTGNGTNIPLFDGQGFDDAGRHRMKMVVDGQTARLFLDGILGAEVPYPYSSGLSFGFGAYVLDARDVVTGTFDNAKLSGGAASVLKAELLADGKVKISWTGPGALQSTPAVQPVDWKDVTPAPAGNSLTITPTQAKSQFYRLKQ